MTRCGDSNEWISAGVHGSIAAAYTVMIAMHGTLAARFAKAYLRWVAYPIATIYHIRSTVEHLQRARRI